MTTEPPDRRAAVLYSREDCSLCFTLRRLARRSARRHRIRLVVLDVDSDAALRSRYGDRVPVLLLPGGISVVGRAEARAVDDAFRESARLSRDRVAGEGQAKPGAPGRRGGLAWVRRALSHDSNTTPS